MTRGLALLIVLPVALIDLAVSARAADAAADDQALEAPVPPELPDGTKPVLRDCRITKAQSIGPAGETVESTHRTCHWAVPPAPTGQ